jgi:hypothetical protein
MMIRMFQVLLLAFLSLVVSACSLLDKERSVTQTAEVIALDTAEARILISEQGNQDITQEQSLAKLSPVNRNRRLADIMAHPDGYEQARGAFLAAMLRLPSAALDPGTYYEEIESSQAKCRNDAISTMVYVRVRILSGPLKGTAGWRCGGAEPVNELP